MIIFRFKVFFLKVKRENPIKKYEKNFLLVLFKRRPIIIKLMTRRRLYLSDSKNNAYLSNFGDKNLS